MEASALGFKINALRHRCLLTFSFPFVPLLCDDYVMGLYYINLFIHSEQRKCKNVSKRIFKCDGTLFSCFQPYELKSSSLMYKSYVSFLKGNL